MGSRRAVSALSAVTVLLTGSSFFIPIHLLVSMPCRGRNRSTVASTTLVSNLRVDDNIFAASRDDDNENKLHHWATRAILFSSFDDGIFSNPIARSFLRHSLTDALLRNLVLLTEVELRLISEFSPCNGPCVDTLNYLEVVDQLRERGREALIALTSSIAGEKQTSFDVSNNDVDLWSTEAIQHILHSADKMDKDPFHCVIKVLYIPTAMYALDKRSSNTPGKQRQRARADGKKRRDKVVELVNTLLSTPHDKDDNNFDNNQRQQIDVVTITLDIHDGSLKQPAGSDNTSLFPIDDMAALTTWRPHLIYVDGGNTFWLRYCMEKGNYLSLIRDACTGPNATSVYLGKSAGAIVAGNTVGTATWKEWDDPSVVPEMTSFEDWSNVPGIDIFGGISVFPHMSEEWVETVTRRRDDLSMKGLVCLTEQDALCVMGDERLLIMTSGLE